MRQLTSGDFYLLSKKTQWYTKYENIQNGVQKILGLQRMLLFLPGLDFLFL
jgi:hypothetical protein